MTVGTVLSIVSAAFAIIRWFVEYSQQQKWISEGVAQVILQAMKDSDDAISRAHEARDLVRSHLERNPSDVMSDDGFKRPGD